MRSNNRDREAATPINQQGVGHGKRWKRPAQEARQAVVLIAAVVSAHYLPDIIAVPMKNPEDAARWLAYILGAIQTCVVLWILAGYLKENLLALLAIYVGFLEEAQVAVCGIAGFGEERVVPLFSGLCVEIFGGWPYALILATGAVALVRAGK